MDSIMAAKCGCGIVKQLVAVQLSESREHKEGLPTKPQVWLPRSLSLSKDSTAFHKVAPVGNHS